MQMKQDLSGAPSESRHLCALMFTDMVAFSAMGQRNEALAVDVMEEQRRLVRAELSPVPHARGTVGMATEGKDTGSSQFFFNEGWNVSLDDRYTVFAEVVAGILREAREDPEIAREAPYTTPVRRLDEAGAARRPVVRQALD